MVCSGSCEGCACPKTNHDVDDIENLPRMQEQLRAANERASELELLLAEALTSSAAATSRLKSSTTQQDPVTDVIRVTTKLRSSEWFNNKDNPAMTALYIERYLNYGLTVSELQSNKPIIGIAQTGSDLSPCNRHHQVLAERVREGIREAGGVAFEFPCHPIQETGKRPTASLDRNLAYLSLVEILYGYPLDGVVLLTGCDKTTPALLMAAATVNIPAIVLNVGPMLNGYWENEMTGSGTIIWKSRERHARGDIDYQQFMDIVGSSAPSVGHCNTMGTASTMNALAEALGMALPGSSAIPAPYRERGQMSYRTGLRIVGMVREDLRPSDILTRQAFENAIVVNAAIGGSTNAPVHLNAIAAHIGVALSMDDWQKLGHKIPLLLNMQPAGEYLGEEYHRAGGLPAILAELKDAGKLHENAMTVNGCTIGANTNQKSRDRKVIYPYNKPLMENAGFLNLQGTLFDSAIMKTCVISKEFKDRYLSNPFSPNVFEGKCVVFDGPEEYHKSIDTVVEMDEYTIMIMRGAGPLGYPGAAEVVNLQPPGRLLKQGITTMPCIGDGRQSGTSGTPSILNASPESAVDGSGLSIVRTGDRIRIDLNACRVDLLIDEGNMAKRHAELALKNEPRFPESQTPWQEMFRDGVDQLAQGMVMKKAIKYQRIVQKYGTPRDNH